MRSLKPSIVHLSPFLDAGNTEQFRKVLELGKTGTTSDLTLRATDVPHGDAVDIGPARIGSR